MLKSINLNNIFLALAKQFKKTFLAKPRISPLYLAAANAKRRSYVIKNVGIENERMIQRC